MHLLALDSCRSAEVNAYWCPDYFNDPFERHKIAVALREHVSLTLRSVAFGLVIAFVVAVLVRRRKALRAGAIGFAGLLYTVPSVAAFALLATALGTKRDTAVVVALTAYNLLVLLRNVLVGFDGVPEEAVEAARGLGYGRARLLWTVELPLALPSIVAGIRIATVSTIGIVSVAAVIGFGGLGALFLAGIQASTPYHAEIATALVLSVALAVVAEVVLLGIQRVLSPWQRKRVAR